MARHPKARLDHLRDIGWRLWDPIGLLDADEDWRTAGFADEYDTYLLHAAGMIRKGEPASAVAAYLYWVETVTIGLGERETTHARIEAAVQALVEENLWTEPGGA
jgi:hypothetical protein